MSGRVNLHLDKELMDDYVERAAVASIRYISPSNAFEGGRKVEEVVLPSGLSEPTPVDLPVGRYLIEAYLPSGDIVSDQVQVVEGGVVDVRLRPDESPHEWLSWQQFLGMVERHDVYESRWDSEPSFSTTATWVTQPVPELSGESPESGDAWALLADALASHRDIAPSLAQTPPQRVDPYQVDDHSHLFQMTRAGSWDEWDPPTEYAYGTPHTPRQYLIVSSHAPRLVCLPTPWINVATHCEVPAQVLARRGDHDSVAVSVTVRDVLYGPALGYMTHGALTTAAQLFDLGREMLFDKVTNPLAAAAGGYVLLATERTPGHKDWHNWISNLMTLFAWLPDGALQVAGLRLRHRTTSSDLEEARAALVTAYRRGIPFYSVGFQWLIDGLTLFAPHDPELRTMLQNVRLVASGVNSGEPFTTLRPSVQ